MKILLIVILILSQSIFANGLKVIDKLSDIPINKDVVLIFSLHFCPYCKKQEKSIIKKVQPILPNITYLKVMKGSKVFQKLNDTGNFDEIEYYPTSFIIKINKKNKIDVKYLFKGLQHSKNILRVLNDPDIMAD